MALDDYSELELLALSQQGGKWGFTQSLINTNGQSMLTVDLPAWMARSWSLTLLAMKYQSGVLPLGAAAPANNQVTAPGITVRVDYGVDSAMESVKFDYPKRGCTVQFAAAVMRVYIDFNASFAAFSVPPIVGGFLAPCTARGGTSQDALPSCTLTEFELVGGANRTFWAPAHARAYRLMPIDDAAYAALCNLRQVGGAGDLLATDLSGQSMGQGNQGTTARPVYIPLRSQAEGVTVEALAAGPYAIQWLLDIG